MKKLLPLILLSGIILVFFWQFLFKGLLPVPSDTIVGLYYPFREAYFKTNPNGIPFKNFLITDPVRQQIPWKNLVMGLEKKINLPLWNPYNFAGTTLLANFQSAAFYPLNILFFVLPLNLSWSFLILLQPLLAGIFLYLYLSNLKLNKSASFLGAIAFSLSGFFVAWLEWGTILNVALWLPLILLAIDKMFNFSRQSRDLAATRQFSIPLWPLIFIFSLTSSFFAGHLQTFFYLGALIVTYFFARWMQYGKKLQVLGLFILLNSIFLILILPQLIPTIKFITLSARNLDLPSWQTNPGWFIPWQNLIQFLAPDFFGNPATLNYYGVWNYGEFVGYIGILPLLMAFLALFFRRDKKTLFFGSVFFISLIFALPTFLAKLPFQLNLPLISTSQPTRLLFVVDFSLSILAALGLDYFISAKNKKQIISILVAFSLFFAAFWSFILAFHGNILPTENLNVARQNLILPTILFAVFMTMILLFIVFYSRKKATSLLLGALILMTIFDLFRFGWKFEPFTSQRYFFPSASTMSFLQSQKQPFRIMSTDSRIFPPNFSIMYKLQTLDGYDPLYLQRFGELMIASSRGKPDIAPPFGFNRIITPHDPLSKVADLAGVKYVLSLDKINNPKLNLVFSDGILRIYENKAAFPRAFFVSNTLLVSSKQQAINALFDPNIALAKTAVVEDVQNKNLFSSNFKIGKVAVINYSENKIILKINNTGKGFLVLTDSYYPTWHAKIDGKEALIYLADYNFRGIIVPKGEHTIEFYDTLF